MDRSEIVTGWIAASDWAKWHRHPMTGDASARRYERLTTNGSSTILMDAPPDTCGSQKRFVEIAKHLRGLGLAAPDVLAWDETLGLMVLEDLGATDFASHLRAHPAEEAMLYSKAAQTLRILQSAPPPDGLVQMTPAVGADMVDIAFEWAASDKSVDLKAQIKDSLRSLLATHAQDSTCLSLRDFHAENLIWRPEENGADQVGLLDFQDAFIAHPAYDLASLLRDARRDVGTDLLEMLVCEMAPPSGHAAFRQAFHVIAIQRNLRILGIFHRLAQQDGKTGYLALLPRVWRHLQTDLAAPVARPLSQLVNRAFAAPKGPV